MACQRANGGGRVCDGPAAGQNVAAMKMQAGNNVVVYEGDCLLVEAVKDAVAPGYDASLTESGQLVAKILVASSYTDLCISSAKIVYPVRIEDVPGCSLHQIEPMSGLDFRCWDCDSSIAGSRRYVPKGAVCVYQTSNPNRYCGHPIWSRYVCHGDNQFYIDRAGHSLLDKYNCSISFDRTEGVHILCDGRFASNPMTVLPDSGAPPNVKTLIVRHHAIDQIPVRKTFAAQQLEHLDLSFNNITSISGVSMLSLTGLRHFNISHNRITRLHPDLLPFNNRLDVLDVRGNDIQILRADTFVSAMRSNCAALLLPDTCNPPIVPCNAFLATDPTGSASATPTIIDLTSSSTTTTTTTTTTTNSSEFGLSTVRPAASCRVVDTSVTLTCRSGATYRASQLCDGIPDCPDADDEEACTQVWDTSEAFLIKDCTSGRMVVRFDHGHVFARSEDESVVVPCFTLTYLRLMYFGSTKPSEEEGQPQWRFSSVEDRLTIHYDLNRTTLSIHAYIDGSELATSYTLANLIILTKSTTDAPRLPGTTTPHSLSTARQAHGPQHVVVFATIAGALLLCAVGATILIRRARRRRPIPWLDDVSNEQVLAQRLQVALARTTTSPTAGAKFDSMSVAAVPKHGCGIIHRDIAARNVLLQQAVADPFAVEVVLSDFGHARLLTRGTEGSENNPDPATDMSAGMASNPVFESGPSRDDEAAHGGEYYRQHSTIQTAVRWQPPESLARDSFSPASDMWSYGVLLYELWSMGQTPYVEVVSEANVATAIMQGYPLQLSVEARTGFAQVPGLFELWGRLMVFAPGRRASSAEAVGLLQHAVHLSQQATVAAPSRAWCDGSLGEIDNFNESQL
ncbi:uncharacterized protein MONBRDRAFT_38718 [Monosiga brevicollis MX1]|uniref:Protein kinase domain-containing protein n=1 Tax=Monosiga brevicollis TaxID=81824 RepID=A9V9Q0_MONBE|nr:uncharacterized protein MONBRDRAFT_38718 [Monosiga brevicollis MX1]EDQ85706.1 predicted protein [Monosiga brevicollis MX1]|eukprot:XP_001749421.1 hypothetical protein [Monosiga brevicollis MX1]